jgi:hypothetical protein
MKFYGIQNEVKAYINRLQDENGIFVSASDIKTINDRVESLKRSGVWSRFSLGFNDVDGDAYLTRAGVVNPLGRCEVIWFVRGIKALGLWNSILCWPMRNYQNKGTAATVFSLGGLGIYDGTLNNSPSWSAAGINYTPANSCMIQTYKLATGRHTIFAAAYNGSIVANGQIYRITETGNTFHFWQRRNGSSSSLLSPNTDLTSYVNGSVSSTMPVNSFFTTAITTSRTFTTPIVNSCFGDTSNTQQWGDLGVFNSIINLELSASQISFVYTLYKNTLGNGLGLP